MHELISLQFGDFANLVGAHYWNAQARLYDAYQGQNSSAQLPTNRLFLGSGLVPRLIAVGNTTPPGSLEHLNEIPNIATWSGQLDVHLTPQINSTTTNWRALSKIEYHERSLLLGNRNQVCSLQADQICESLRYIAETCDQIQGFQLCYDRSALWGSLLSSTMMSIQDQFPKQPIISFLPRDPTSKPFHQQRVDDIISLALMLEFSEIVVPISQHQSKKAVASGVEIDPDSSSLFGALMDSLSLPYRLNSQPLFDLTSMSTFYSHGGRSSSLLGVCSLLGPDLDLTQCGPESWTSHSEMIPIPIDHHLETEIITMRGFVEEKHGDSMRSLLEFEGFRRLCRTFWSPYGVEISSNKSLMISRLVSSKEIENKTRSFLKDKTLEKNQKAIDLAFEQWGTTLHYNDLTQAKETILEFIKDS